MIYLIFAILFSASLALALRIRETFSDNRYGILVGNYVTCLVAVSYTHLDVYKRQRGWRRTMPGKVQNTRKPAVR